MYYDFKFRKCSREQLFQNNGRFDRVLHNKDFQKSSKPLWFGYLYWNTETIIHEDFILESKPNEIECSYNSNVLEKANEKTTGTLCFFKCFKIIKQKVAHDHEIQKKIESFTWQHYNNFRLQIDSNGI